MSTRGMPIGGGIGYPTSDAQRRRWVRKHGGGLAPKRVETLLDRYGTRAAAVIRAIVADASDRPLESVPSVSTAELRHLVRTEAVVHLDDVLLRRTSLAFLGMASDELAREIADVVAGDLGWDASRCEVEVARARDAAERAIPPDSRAASGRTDAAQIV